MKISYSSDEDDLLNDFLIPCLSVSKKYDRLSGFFSSKLFIFVLRGLSKFIENNGKMRLIIGVLPSDDLEVINRAFDDVKDELEDDFINQMVEIKDIPEDAHLKILSWMINRDILKVKLAFLVKENGKVPSKNEIFEILRSGIMHEKIGLFFDKKGNSVSFSGSINETVYGWIENDEEFKVFLSWEQEEYRKKDELKFIKFWNDVGNRVRVVSLPNKAISYIKKFLPEKIPNHELEIINSLYLKIREKETQESKDESNWKYNKESGVLKIEDLKLRNCQQSALEELNKNNFNGILQMATGTGKTLAAIYAVYELLKEIKRGIIIIIVPQIYLVEQWNEVVSEFHEEIIGVHSVNKRWRSLLNLKLELFKRERIDNFFIITTINSFKEVTTDLKRISSKNLILIGDEVHKLGAPVIKNVLSKFKAEYKIGLSATPRRYFDDEGTEFLLEYFGGIIFEYTIKQGIKDGYLCEYNYYLQFCNLLPEEYIDYMELTDQIKRLMYRKNEEGEEKEILENIIFKRADIVKKAANKLEKLKIILQIINDKFKPKFPESIIYCDDIEHLSMVETILLDAHINFEKFVASTPLEERKKIISRLEDGFIETILAIACLDEGIDIPSLKVGIIISSSNNVKQFIQRKGRLLRRHPTKTRPVEIYDFLVEDPIVYEKERNRVNFFYEDCSNQNELFKRLWDLEHSK